MENALKTTGAGTPAGAPLHLVMYIGSLQKGGAERVMCNLAEYFYQQGYRVTLVTTYFHPPEYEPAPAAWDYKTGEVLASAKGLEGDARGGIHRVYSDPDESIMTKSRIKNFIIRFKNLNRIWTQLKPDLILSFSGKNNIMAIMTARGVKHVNLAGKIVQVPTVVSVRGMPAREYSGKGMKQSAFYSFKKAEGIVLQTNGAAEFFPEAIRKKSIILPNSINPDFIRPLYEGERTKNIVLVGRLDDNKNEELFIRAFAKAAKDHPDWSADICGGGPNLEKYKALAEELGISSQTRLHGIVSDVADRIQKAGIFVLPSKTEGMPNALIEAMSLGLACISTDCPSGGPKDLIKDGVNGFLVPVNDEKAKAAGYESAADAMAEKLTLLMEDDKLREKLGKEAFRVQEDYTPEIINAKWKAYFESLM